MKPLLQLPEHIIKRVQQRLMTGREAAETLGISEQYFCQLFKPYTRIAGITSTKRHAISLITSARHEFRKQLADDIRAKRKTIAQAALAGNCTERTIYRYLNGEHQ